MSCVVFEDLLRRHFAYCLGDASIHEVYHLTAPDKIDQRYDYKPHKEASAADDECIFETYYITEAQNCCTCVDLKHKLCLVRYGRAPRENFGRECFAPKSEC